MIDNPGRAASLMEQLPGYLPLPAFPTKELVRTLRRGGVKASVDRALSIKRVFYAGDEGGIVCDVTPNQSAKAVFVVSLTHLRIAPHHPFAAPILAYQLERVRRLTAAEHAPQARLTRRRERPACEQQRPIDCV
jgi:hypothetical protein